MKKLARLFVGSLFALFLSTQADASTLTCPGSGTLGSCSIEKYSASAFGFTTADYLVSGTLQNNTKIDITFEATNVSSSFHKLAKGSLLLNEGESASLSALRGAWPTLSTSAVFTPDNARKGTLIDTITLVNTSGGAERFAAYFLSLLKLLSCGNVTVTAVISSIPLPASFWLFATSLALVGFAASRKKARGGAV